MKMKYIAVAILFIGLVGLAGALVPPPPANQLLGIYDTTVNNFNETICRGCHTSTGSGGAFGGATAVSSPVTRGSSLFLL